MAELGATVYLAFPLRVNADGPATSGRSRHIREQIEQVLFTNPGERVFRPEFGAGVRALVFEPNSTTLWDLTRKRLSASLSEALRGEVDPRTLEIEVEGEGEKLKVLISYTLATIGHSERHEILVGTGGGTSG
ncbi:MAG: GPW/gp25 family protein [Acidobacteriota bacterium]|nr:GPW/gp25 family protein [Acidobacteriota bacterium]MDH3523212.1 GPW/gp25 family protein [Acidobacteriota bacterium]